MSPLSFAPQNPERRPARPQTPDDSGVHERPLVVAPDASRERNHRRLPDIYARFEALDDVYGQQRFEDPRPSRATPPPIPLEPTRADRLHGHTTYLRRHNEDLAPINTKQRVAPFMKEGVIDTKTAEFFNRKREIAKLIYEANASFARAERAFVETKRNLGRITELARSLDNGQARLAMDADVTELSSELLEDDEDSDRISSADLQTL